MADRIPAYAIALNKEIKKEFGARRGYAKVSTGRVGSFPFVRFDGDMSMSFMTDVRNYLERHHPEFTYVNGSPATTRHRYASGFAFIESGSVINWVTIS